MAEPDPVDEIGGIDEPGVNVSKDGFRQYSKAHTLGVFADAADVRARNLSLRTRIIAGSRFFRLDTEDTQADDGTEATPVIIDGVGNHWVVIEGERYDLQFSGTGQIGPAEGLNPGFAPADQPLELLAGIPGSFWYAIDVVPTSEHVTSFKMSIDAGESWVELFTATIPAGQREGVFSLVADVTMPAGAILRPYGPAVSDATLQTLGGVIVTRR